MGIGWVIAAGVLIAFVVWVAVKNKIKAVEATDYIMGALIIGGFVFYFMVFVLDDVFARTPIWLQQQWGDVVSGVDLKEIQNPLNSAYEQPSPPQVTAVVANPLIGGVVHTVAPGETLSDIASLYGMTVGEVAGMNGIQDVNSIHVGQRLSLSAAPATPTPTPEPLVIPWAPRVATAVPLVTDFSEEYAVLDGYKRDGNIEAAEVVALSIIETNQNDTYATAVLNEIAQARVLAESWQALGNKSEGNALVSGKFVYGDDTDIFPLLNGFRFEVVSVEPMALLTKWQETAVLRCVSKGWLYGQEFSLARGHLRRFDVKDVDDVIDLE